MEEVCRICLELVTSSCSEPVEDVTKEVLKVLLIDVDLSLSEKPVICLRCKRRIEEFCDFKIICIETEDCLQPYLRGKTDVVDLKRVYLDSLTPEETEYGSERLQICRLCMKSKHCEYFSLSIEVLAVFGIKEAFLKKFIPEVCLNATKSPIICQSCLKLFVGFAKFIMSWSRIEKKIIGYCSMTRIGNKGRVNLGKIARFIKNVTPGLISSDKQDDLDFLQCIDNIVKTGNQRCMEERVPPVDENRSEKHERLTKTAAGQLQEGAKQLLVDKQKRTGKKKLDVKNQAKTKPKLAAKTDEQTARRMKHRVSKKRIVGRKEEHIQAHVGEPRSLLDPVQKQLIVLIEKMSNLKATQAKPRQNTGPEPKIEAKQSASTGKKTYSCPECNFTSVYKHTVRKHFFRKHQLISCADCPFTTTSKCKLKVHITKFHRLFRCSFCPRTYTTFIGRRVHVNAQHAITSKTYKCLHCDFESKYQSNVKKHEETHSERKVLYRCDSCSYSSNFSNNVRRHALSHLDASDVTMFKCYQCSYDTRWKGDLMNHIKYLHLEATEMLQCPKCPYKTKYKYCLALHSGKHDNIVYRCDKCIFRTVNKGSWKKHSLVHEHS